MNVTVTNPITSEPVEVALQIITGVTSYPDGRVTLTVSGTGQVELLPVSETPAL